MGIYFLMQDHCIPGQNEQKKETKKGTLKSHMIPLTMAAGRISLPDTLRITGRHTSIAVAPADATGANGPKCLFICPYFYSHKEQHQAYDGGNGCPCMPQESAPPEYETCTYSCRQCQYQINHNSQKSAKDSNFRIKAQIEYLMKNV